MRLKLVRMYFYEKSTIGKLFVDDVFECFTLEDKVREPGLKVPKDTAIPYGIYRVIIDRSDKFKRLMPHILNVPMFDGIRIHSGNTDADVEGCILVGDTWVNQDFIGASRVSFDRLFPKLETAFNTGEEIWIEIVSQDK